MIAETGKQAEDVAPRKHTTASRFRATGLRAALPMFLAQASSLTQTYPSPTSRSISEEALR